MTGDYFFKTFIFTRATRSIYVKIYIKEEEEEGETIILIIKLFFRSFNLCISKMDKHFISIIEFEEKKKRKKKRKKKQIDTGLLHFLFGIRRNNFVSTT